MANSAEPPVPEPPLEILSAGSSPASDKESLDENYELREDTDRKPHLITGPDLNDLVRDLYLTKHQSELLASPLQQWRVMPIKQEFHQLKSDPGNCSSSFLWTKIFASAMISRECFMI